MKTFIIFFWFAVNPALDHTKVNYDVWESLPKCEAYVEKLITVHPGAFAGCMEIEPKDMENPVNGYIEIDKRYEEYLRKKENHPRQPEKFKHFS